MNEKEVELAKSWFALSQIIIILAGFFFTISGIMLGLYEQNKNNAAQEWDKMLEGLPLIANNWNQFTPEAKSLLFSWSNITMETYLGHVTKYTDESKNFLIFFIITLIVGFILAIFSLNRFCKGRKELRKLN